MKKSITNSLKEFLNNRNLYLSSHPNNFMKLKIKSSARIKNHYLLIRGKKSEVEKAILDYIGILGWAKASPKFITSQENLILSIERKSVTNVRASFEASPYDIKVLKVSGTLKGVQGK